MDDDTNTLLWKDLAMEFRAERDEARKALREAGLDQGNLKFELKKAQEALEVVRAQREDVNNELLREREGLLWQINEAEKALNKLQTEYTAVCRASDAKAIQSSFTSKQRNEALAELDRTKLALAKVRKDRNEVLDRLAVANVALGKLGEANDSLQKAYNAALKDVTKFVNASSADALRPEDRHGQVKRCGFDRGDKLCSLPYGHSDPCFS